MRLAAAPLLVIFFFTFGPSLHAKADSIEDALSVIAKAGPAGEKIETVRASRNELARADATVLPRLLAAMDTPNLVAANWIRTAFEEIVERELAREQPEFSISALKDFVRDKRRAGRVRRRVLALLDRLDPKFGPALMPTLLDDPEFYNDAIALALEEGDRLKKSGDTENAMAQYRLALNHARDRDMVTRSAARLKSVGEEVDVAGHLGLVTRWYLIGPFDAPVKTGFELEFPPENNVDLEASYEGQKAAVLEWKLHETSDRLGLVNLNRALVATREAVGYAYAEIRSSKDQAVEMRCGADDNISVWLNGKPIFARKQWLNGNRFDRFTAPAQLRKGTNRVLVKICQGPQHKNPAVPNNWSFQLRFCNSIGRQVGLTELLPVPETSAPKTP